MISKRRDEFPANQTNTSPNNPTKPNKIRSQFLGIGAKINRKNQTNSEMLLNKNEYETYELKERLQLGEAAAYRWELIVRAMPCIVVE